MKSLFSLFLALVVLGAVQQACANVYDEVANATMSFASRTGRSCATPVLDMTHARFSFNSTSRKFHWPNGTIRPDNTSLETVFAVTFEGAALCGFLNSSTTASSKYDCLYSTLRTHANMTLLDARALTLYISMSNASTAFNITSNFLSFYFLGNGCNTNAIFSSLAGAGQPSTATSDPTLLAVYLIIAVIGGAALVAAIFFFANCSSESSYRRFRKNTRQ